MYHEKWKEFQELTHTSEETSKMTREEFQEEITYKLKYKELRKMKELEITLTSKES